MTEKQDVGSLWIGGALSAICLASIHSFLNTGHKITIFSYEKIPNLPAGAYAVRLWNNKLQGYLGMLGGIPPKGRFLARYL